MDPKKESKGDCFYPVVTIICVKFSQINHFASLTIRVVIWFGISFRKERLEENSQTNTQTNKN